MALFDSMRSQCAELFETPAGQVAAWHGEMAERAARSDQWQSVIWHLDRMLAAEPADVHGLTLRGTARAELGHWAEAQSDFAAALDLDRAEFERWSDLAMARQAAGDLEGYRELCSDALAQFRDGRTPQAIRGLAELCQAAPGALADPAELVSLTRKAREQWPANPFYVRAHALACYRARDYETAAAELEKFRASGTGPMMDLLGGTYLVLAEQRLGKSAEAGELWKDVSRRLDEWQRKPVTQGGPNWSERVATGSLPREVTALGVE